MFICFCKFNLETKYQISSESPEFYRRYYNKHFGFFRPQCILCVPIQLLLPNQINHYYYYVHLTTSRDCKNAHTHNLYLLSPEDEAPAERHCLWAAFYEESKKN